MRILALDHGAKRIGVAIGDTETGMAFARAAIQRRNLDHDLARVGELCTAEGVSRVVIGLPLNMDGSEGAQAAAARAFGDALARTGLSVTYEDERLSSWEAGRQLGARRPRRESGELDSAAARLILQQYLDARPPTPDLPEETA
ncbi:MAG: Holliday junction resolvase RuvX [Chloroflexota bacterium]|jgi:putative Holliday junction resolvase|nr:Holliday junction resolvase RuvX [Chloroflexota bacterium]